MTPETFSRVTSLAVSLGLMGAVVGLSALAVESMIPVPVAVLLAATGGAAVGIILGVNALVLDAMTRHRHGS